MSNDYEEVKRKSNYIKFNKLNDYIKGTFIKITVPTEPDQFGRLDKKYTILCEEGHVYGGTMEKDTGNYIVDSVATTLEPGREYIITGKPSLDASMAEIPVGYKCMVQLYEFKQSKKGNRPAKVMKVFKGAQDTEWIESQKAATWEDTDSSTLP